MNSSSGRALGKGPCNGKHLQRARSAVARASTRMVGYRNSWVSWGRPFERVYDQNGRLVASHMKGFDAELGGINYGVETPIYNSSWSAFALFLNSPQKTL